MGNILKYIGKIYLIITASFAITQGGYAQENTADGTYPTKSGFEVDVRGESQESLIVNHERTHDTKSPITQTINNDLFDTEELAQDPSTTKNPFAVKLKAESIESLVIGPDDSGERTSKFIDEIPIGIPYRAQKYRNEQEALSDHPFPKINKPITIQSKIQEDAEEQGY